MRRTRGWTALKNSVAALGLVAASAGVTRADPMTSTLIAYNTVGSSIGTAGVTTSGGAPTTPALSFVPLTGGAFLSPSSLDLGMFQAAALGNGQTVTYNNTPFDLKFRVDGVNGVPAFLADGITPGFQPNGTPVDVTGKLNGTLTGANQSNLTATFDAPASVAFATGLYSNTLAISNNPVTIVPSSTHEGMTTVQAMLTTQVTPAIPAPEPSTIVLFAATIAGLGFRHRLRRARAAG